ncbi:unnamed protein product [Fusarium graminearum]|uniref:Uncharacterized protein n=1 Tax=Gibberella zeae TaxID=5518 RepID=A0A9N8NBE0_GIBZA|nr:unnamed protein product [Fusarium graminearum]CAG1964664.1 unnamed protein product [Fusarium graminearum]CZS83118.1 unnamed protein product [Fusarium graminearum]
MVEGQLSGVRDLLSSLIALQDGLSFNTSFRWPKSSNETWIGRAENWTVSALTLAYTQFADIYSEQFYMALLAATQAKMNRRNPTIDHPTANKQKKPINHRQSIAPTENVTT